MAHNIEKAEWEIYASIANTAQKTISLKQFRHDYPNQRLKVVAGIKDTWDGVLSVSSLLDLTLDAAFMLSALSLFPSVGLDGYDLFMAETAIQKGIDQIVTDDGDYATVPRLTVFTANPKVIQKAQDVSKLLVR